MTQILADENIPLAKEAFSHLGDVHLAHGRKIDRAMLADTEILIVRSITSVNAELLEGTPVRFVGTATIGTDHIDLDYLRERGITFADAAGCNANSVAEYITAALLDLEAALGMSLKGKTLGVVGVGNVGSKVAEKGGALGMQVLLNDPPRAELEGDSSFVSLDKILAESDFVSLHTPLTRAGNHRTFHLIAEPQLKQMKPTSVLLNTARGPVVDGKALRSALEKETISKAVLDVWENEPTPGPQLLDKVHIATPHIAGYSFDGKLTGLRMMYEAVKEYIGSQEENDETLFQVPVDNPQMELISTGREAIREAVFRAYPILADDGRMRGLLELPAEKVGPAFDRLRKEYPIRREYPGYHVCGAYLDEETLGTLERLGFTIERE